MKKLVIVALAALAFSACGKKSKAAASNVQEAFKDLALQGSWQAEECRDVPNEWRTRLAALVQGGPQAAAEVPNLTSRVEYKFQPTKVTRKTVVYQSEKGKCEGPELVRFEETGNLKIESDPNKKVDGGTPIDLDFNKLKATPVGDLGVQFMNAVQMCGFNDWQKDTAKTVAENNTDKATCYQIKVPRKLVNLYRIENKNTLYLGKDPAASEGKAETERPKSVTPKSGLEKITDQVVKFNKH